MLDDRREAKSENNDGNLEEVGQEIRKSEINAQKRV